MSFLLPPSENFRETLLLSAVLLIFLERLVVSIPTGWIRNRFFILILIVGCLGHFIYPFTEAFLGGDWAAYARGKRLHIKQEYKLAERELFASLNWNPAFYRAYMKLGEIYMDTGEYRKAIQVRLLAIPFLKSDLSNQKINYWCIADAYFRERDAEKMWFYAEKADAVKIKLGRESSWWSPEPWRYIAFHDKKRFSQAMETLKLVMPQEIHARIMNLRTDLEKGKSKDVFLESQRYLEENEGTIYRTAFLSLMDEALKKMERNDADYALLKKAYESASQ